MYVRNFWIEAEIDGRKTVLAGGPKSREGGLSLSLFQRSEGEVEEALEILCRARPDGLLRLLIRPTLPAKIAERELIIETRR